VILREGDPGIAFFVINTGHCEVLRGAGPDQQVINQLKSGDSFGEMALLDHEGRSATITAATDVTLATIPEWNFKPFLKEHPEVAFRLLQVLSQRVRQAESDT